jgi:hypothetical protein
MVGFTLLSRSYYYLRRRSPGPPFPPDHRQAGERGAIILNILPYFVLSNCPTLRARGHLGPSGRSGALQISPGRVMDG